MTGETGRLIEAGIRGTTSGWTCTGKIGLELKLFFEFVKGRELSKALGRFASQFGSVPNGTFKVDLRGLHWHVSVKSTRLDCVTIIVSKDSTYLNQKYPTVQ